MKDVMRRPHHISRKAGEVFYNTTKLKNFFKKNARYIDRNDNSSEWNDPNFKPEPGDWIFYLNTDDKKHKHSGIVVSEVKGARVRAMAAGLCGLPRRAMPKYVGSTCRMTNMPVTDWPSWAEATVAPTAVIKLAARV